MKKTLLIFVIILTSCSKIQTFSEKALQEKFKDVNQQEISFKNIKEKYKGKKVFIDIWASWCGDCINGLPKVKKVQETYPDAVYLFLSADKTVKDWKIAIDKYNIKGEHYFMTSGTKGDFGTSINIDWIPRYLVLNENGDIDVFKEVHADVSTINDALK